MATTLESVLREVMEATQGSINVGLPGTVLSYDATTQTCTVQLGVRVAHKDPDEDSLVPIAIEPITQVPVKFPSSQDSSITFPLQAGDTGHVEFCDRSIDEWMTTGNDTVVPLLNRRHDFSDALFYPGLRPKTNPIPETDVGDGLFLTHKGTQVRVGDESFAVQNSTTELLADLVAVLNQIKTGIISTPSGPGAFDAATQTALTTIINRIASLEE